MTIAPQANLFFRQFAKIVRPIEPVISVPLRRTLASAEIVMTVEMPFADVTGVIAGILKVAPHSGDVFAWRDVVGPRAGLVSVDTGK